MSNTSKICYILIGFAVMLCLYSFTISKLSNPEEKIIGNWSEKKWEYEKVYDLADKKELDAAGDYQIQNVAGNSLILHMAEQWQFYSNGQLVFCKDKSKNSAKWKIKGRGNILEIEHKDGLCEHYNIIELNQQRMVLNFNAEMQIKGITKLTFNKS